MTSQCGTCSFELFCSAYHECSHSTDFLNSAVKKNIYLKRKEELALPKHQFKNFYAIKRGAVKSYRIGVEGNEMIQGFYFAGEVLGYDAIFTGHYSYSVTALTDTLICEIPYDHLLDLIHQYPELQKRILYLSSQQLNVGSYVTMTSAEQRMAGFLLDLVKRLPVLQHHELALPMTRQDIGNYLGLTTETVSRLLSRFQQEALIKIDNKRVFIQQIDALQKIA